ncbi:unnamed protein product [Leuciscus chuanchicus]
MSPQDIQTDVDIQTDLSKRALRGQIPNTKAQELDKFRDVDHIHIASRRECLEAGAEKWTGLIDILEELWLCVKLKDEELTRQRPVGEDAHTLLQQQGYCTALHRELIGQNADGTLNQVCLSLAVQPTTMEVQRSTETAAVETINLIGHKVKSERVLKGTDVNLITEERSESSVMTHKSFSFKCEDHLLAGSEEEEEEHEKPFCLLAMEESQQQSDDADSTAAEKQRFSSVAIRRD